MDDVGTRRTLGDSLDQVAIELGLQRLEQVDLGALAELVAVVFLELAREIFEPARELLRIFEVFRVRGVQCVALVRLERLAGLLQALSQPVASSRLERLDGRPPLLLLFSASTSFS